MQEITLEENGQTIFVVDYDIPSKPSARRRTFYRRLKKLKEKMGLFGAMSTESVLITSDRYLAENVYRLASLYGKANIYIGKKLNIFAPI